MTTTTTQTTFLGYTVEKLVEEPGRKCQPAYYLRGPRGALYGLYRNLSRPHLLYACSGRNGNVLALKGNSWFSDKDGYLTACN